MEQFCSKRGVQRTSHLPKLACRFKMLLNDIVPTIPRAVRTKKTSSSARCGMALWQGKAKQGKARQGKARQDKARQDKARQDKTNQGKTRQDKKRRVGEWGIIGTCPRHLSKT